MYKRIINKSNPPNSTNEILNEYVFLNKLIQIDHNSILPSNLGLQISESLMDLNINDLLNANGKFMLPIDLREKKNWKISILHVNSLLSAIPRTWISEIEKSDSGYNEIPQSAVILKKLSKTDFRGKEPRFILGTFKKDYNATNSNRYLDRSFPLFGTSKLGTFVHLCEQSNFRAIFTVFSI